MPFPKTSKEINLFALYSLQEQISQDNHRFKVIACGRRWGKSLMAIRMALTMLIQNFVHTQKKQRGWIVAPTFPLVREDWLIAEDILKDAIVDKKLTEMRMDFAGDIGFLEFKSAEREDEGLRGAGLDCCVLDEASRISRKSWEQGIRPALADKQGRAIFISTPKGKNWFYEMFMKGKEENKEIKSWQYPTYTNPYFPQAEWKIVEDTTPQMILKQEYLADFLEDEASVFKNIFSCLRGNLEEPLDEYYTIGLDLGRTEDFTVAVVIRNLTCQVVALYRQNKVDWSLQKKQIKALTQRFRKSIVHIDSTGLGDPIEEDLRKDGVNTKDFKFTNQSKQELVEQLIVAIEQGLIGIPDCQETKFLIDELKAFSYEVLPSGRIRYQAPQGLHDDGVIALGLAVRGISHLLYSKYQPKKEEKKNGMTMDDWERYYASIDGVQNENPFLTREDAREISRIRDINRLLARV